MIGNRPGGLPKCPVETGKNILVEQSHNYKFPTTKDGAKKIISTIQIFESMQHSHRYRGGWG